jgi:hypothetical protein
VLAQKSGFLNIILLMDNQSQANNSNNDNKPPNLATSNSDSSNSNNNNKRKLSTVVYETSSKQLEQAGGPQQSEEQGKEKKRKTGKKQEKDGDAEDAGGDSEQQKSKEEADQQQEDSETKRAKDCQQQQQSHDVLVSLLQSNKTDYAYELVFNEPYTLQRIHKGFEDLKMSTVYWEVHKRGIVSRCLTADQCHMIYAKLACRVHLAGPTSSNSDENKGEKTETPAHSFKLDVKQCCSTLSSMPSTCSLHICKRLKEESIDIRAVDKVNRSITRINLNCIEEIDNGERHDFDIPAFQYDFTLAFQMEDLRNMFKLFEKNGLTTVEFTIFTLQEDTASSRPAASSSSASSSSSSSANNANGNAAANTTKCTTFVCLRAGSPTDSIRVDRLFYATSEMNVREIENRIVAEGTEPQQQTEEADLMEVDEYSTAPLEATTNMNNKSSNKQMLRITTMMRTSSELDQEAPTFLQKHNIADCKQEYRDTFKLTNMCNFVKSNGPDIYFCFINKNKDPNVPLVMYAPSGDNYSFTALFIAPIVQAAQSDSS